MKMDFLRFRSALAVTALLSGALVLSACGSDSTPADGGVKDTGTTNNPDAGSTEEPDSGSTTPDSGRPDSGRPDSGMRDSGVAACAIGDEGCPCKGIASQHCTSLDRMS